MKKTIIEKEAIKETFKTEYNDRETKTSSRGGTEKVSPIKEETITKHLDRQYKEGKLTESEYKGFKGEEGNDVGRDSGRIADAKDSSPERPEQPRQEQLTPHTLKSTQPQPTEIKIAELLNDAETQKEIVGLPDEKKGIPIQVLLNMQK